MRKLGITLISTLLLCLLTTGAVSAQEKSGIKKTVNISEDVMVGDTLVKRGTYTVKFDAQSNEVTFFNDGKAVARAKAMVEEGNTKSRYTAVTITASEKGRKLDRLAFEGDRRIVVIGENATATGSGQ